MEIKIIIIRFLITFILSLLFGYERQRSHKPIGFGTFIFVANGSCALAITAITLYPENPLPLLGAIVTGIGFLGAGALIKTTDKIFGFTTAASIWVFAIFGLSIGVGQYIIGGILYIFVWMIILFDFYFEQKGIGSYRKRIMINTNRIVSSKEIENILSTGVKKYHLVSIKLDKGGRSSLVYLIEGSKEEMNKNLNKLLKEEWCELINVE